MLSEGLHICLGQYQVPTPEKYVSMSGRVKSNSAFEMNKNSHNEGNAKVENILPMSKITFHYGMFGEIRNKIEVLTASKKFRIAVAATDALHSSVCRTLPLINFLLDIVLINLYQRSPLLASWTN